MNRSGLMAAGLVAAAAMVAVLAFPRVANAHCDTMDGPVVGAARAALQKGDITPVLRWVKPEAETELKAAFDKARSARKKGGAAQEVADLYFYETLVRLHRAGEGAPYTGLKSTPAEPIVAKSDAAIAAGSVDELTGLLTRAMSKALREKFEHVAETRTRADESVEAGREYVEAYVEFTHYVERLHTDIATGAGHAEGQSHDE